jgi:hypothetical protein
MPARLKTLARSPLAPLTLPVAAVAIIALAMAASAFAQVSPAPNIPAGSTVYRNAQYHFSLVIPPGYEVSELPNSSDFALQIIIDNPADKTADTSFFISILPYSQMNLANVGGNLDEGLKLDPPLNTTDQGDMLGTVDVDVKDLINFHFEKNGTSFTVSTIKDNGPQVANILKTWQFY